MMTNEVQRRLTVRKNFENVGFALLVQGHPQEVRIPWIVFDGNYAVRAFGNAHAVLSGVGGIRSATYRRAAQRLPRPCVHGFWLRLYRNTETSVFGVVISSTGVEIVLLCRGVQSFR